jgi:hypothetical protein
MTATDYSKQPTAWSALLACYADKLADYKAAFEVIDDDDHDGQASLHEGLKPYYDAVLAFPVELPEQLVEKTLILHADYWDPREVMDALARDAERIVGR